MQIYQNPNSYLIPLDLHIWGCLVPQGDWIKKLPRTKSANNVILEGSLFNAKNQKFSAAPRLACDKRVTLRVVDQIYIHTNILARR
jgi:hypothetical protein